MDESPLSSCKCYLSDDNIIWFVAEMATKTPTHRESASTSQNCEHSFSAVNLINHHLHRDLIINLNDRCELGKFLLSQE